MNIKVAAKGILVSQGKVLIVSDENKAMWDFPGGGIENDERLTEALQRELREETGFTDIKIGEMVHVDEWFIKARDLHVIAVFYRCDATEQKRPVLSEEHTNYAWVSLEEARTYEGITEDTLRALEAAKL